MVQSSNDRCGDDRARRRREDRRLEILRAAARAFRRRGYGGTGMREIAAEARLSPGNLYHYFDGKDALLHFCQVRALDRMLAALDRADRDGAAPPERLRRLLRAHVLCLLDEVEGSAAHLEVESLPEALRGPILARRDRYERGVRRLVRAGIRDGAFAACEPETATRAMLGAINGTARWFRPDGPRGAAWVADELAAFLVRGLVGRTGEPRAAGAATGARR